MWNFKTKIIVIGVSMLVGAEVTLAKDSDQEVSGVLSAFSSSLAKVGELACTLTSGTEYEDSFGNSISPSRFSPGDQVRLRCRSGNAKNLKLLDESSSSSSSSSSDSSSSSASSDASSSSSSSSSSRSSRSSSSSSSSSQSLQSGDQRLSASLKALQGISSNMRGKIRYSRSRISKTRRLNISFSLALPSSLPGLADSADAAALNLSVTLFRKGLAYANCGLSLASLTGSNAKFNLALRKIGSKLKQRSGSCDLDLSEEQIQTGFPVIRRKDLLILEDRDLGAFMESKI